MTHEPIVDGDVIVCFDETLGQSVTIQCKTEQEARERAAVCKEARTWVRTPYHHMGRVKGSGVDCATILAEVYPAAGVVLEKVQIDYYPLDWNLNRDAERYMGYITKYMHEITEPDVKMGDVVLFKWGRTFAHGVIVLDPGWPSVIHADITIGRVVYAEADKGRLGQADRDKRYFSPW